MKPIPAYAPPDAERTTLSRARICSLSPLLQSFFFASLPIIFQTAIRRYSYQQVWHVSERSLSMSRYLFGRRPVSLFRGPLRSFLRPSGSG